VNQEEQPELADDEHDSLDDPCRQVGGGDRRAVPLQDREEERPDADGGGRVDEHQGDRERQRGAALGREACDGRRGVQGVFERRVARGIRRGRDEK
jgi:hypothetical protein